MKLLSSCVSTNLQMQTQTLIFLLSACCFVSAASKKGKGKTGGHLKHNATSHNANSTSNLTTTATAARTTTQAGDAVKGMNIAGAVGALAVGAILL